MVQRQPLVDTLDVIYVRAGQLFHDNSRTEVVQTDRAVVVQLRIRAVATRGDASHSRTLEISLEAFENVKE